MGAVTGQTPESPVLSKKSGHLYEKRLILKYIDAEGKVSDGPCLRGLSSPIDRCYFTGRRVDPV